jgi:multidrug efflux system membrane fusion protein
MNKNVQFTVCCIAVCLLAVTSCETNKKEARKIIRPVRYMHVQKGGERQTRVFSGVSKAVVEMRLSFKVAGTIQNIKVKMGDTLRKGALVASVDNTELQLQMEQAKTLLNNAIVQLGTAKSAYERTATLFESNNVSLQNYETAKSAYESAKASVKSHRQNLELAQRQLSYSRLIAPMEGIVTRVPVENNENIMPGQTIAEVNSGKDLEVIVGIPEGYIAQVKEGGSAMVRFTSLPDKEYAGTISEVSFAIDKNSSTYPVSILLEKPDTKIRPGMAADAVMKLADNSTGMAMTVPSNTISEDQTGRFVYIVEITSGDTAIVHRRDVMTGTLVNDGIEIVDGLTDGELVVTAGISSLRDGMVVRLLK